MTLDMLVDPLSELIEDDFLLRLRSGAAMVWCTSVKIATGQINKPHIADRCSSL